MRWLLLLVTLISVASAAAVNANVVGVVDGSTLRLNTTLSVYNDGNETLSGLPLLPGYELFTGEPLPNNTLYFSPIPPGESAGVSLFNTAQDLISQSADYKLFSASFSTPLNVSAFTFVLVLPEGHLLKQSPGMPAVMPDAGFSSNGRNILLVWTGENVTAGQTLSFMAKYEQPFGPMVQFVDNYIPVTDSSLFLPGLILAFLFGYFLSAGLASAILRQVKRIRVNLNPDEKTVVYHLEQHGPTEQARLMRDLGFSKAKLSRLLREMETRGLVTRTPRGKTNLIALR